MASIIIVSSCHVEGPALTCNQHHYRQQQLCERPTHEQHPESSSAAAKGTALTRSPWSSLSPYMKYALQALSPFKRAGGKMPSALTGGMRTPPCGNSIRANWYHYQNPKKPPALTTPPLWCRLGFIAQRECPPGFASLLYKEIYYLIHCFINRYVFT